MTRGPRPLVFLGRGVALFLLASGRLPPRKDPGLRLRASSLRVARAARVLALALVPASLVVTSPASAQVDGRVEAAFQHRGRTGETLPFFRASRAFESSGSLPVLLRLARTPTPAERAKYTALGAVLGRTLTSGAIKARLTEAAFAAMRSDGVLARATVDLPPPVLAHPLDLAAKQIGTRGGREAYRKKNDVLPTGKGVVIGDIDTSADPFHPAFFRTGAPVPWVDVDKNGKLTPGVDGVDVDGDGVIAPTEVLRLMDGKATGLFSSTVIAGTGSPGYDPAWDYLYLDENGDGRRNVGGEVPDAETRPGMSEPTFAGDDVDASGTLTIPERLLPLTESKFRAINHLGKVYRRGENLSTFQPIVSSPEDAMHATSVLGTMAGGQLGVSRFLGHAPDADLLLSTDQWDNDSLADKLQWLHDEGADVAITELGLWGYEVADGSTELETLMDAIVDAGTLMVSPAGNLGESEKHAFGTIPKKGAAPYENELYEVDAAKNVWFSVTWREGDVQVGGTLTTADGETAPLEDGSTKLASGTVYVTTGTTPKGAGYLLVALKLKKALPEKGTKIALSTKGDAPATASLFVIDDVSSWGGGTTFAKSNAEGTICVPAYAKKTIAVGAYALHVGPEFAGFPEKAGALRGYSGRGPDLWGDTAVDLVSPDNAIAAAPDVYGAKSSVAEGKVAHWVEFGGTSGAGPEVAGLAAMLKQANPGASATVIREKLLGSLVKDATIAGEPVSNVGGGKLHVDVALATGAPPKVVLLAPASAAPGASVALTAQINDDGDASKATVRWDVGYDGTWDGDASTATTRSVTMPASGPLDVKVEVVDDQGWSGAAVARVWAPGTGPGGAGGAGGSGGGAGAAGTGGAAASSGGAAGKSGPPVASPLPPPPASAQADDSALEPGGGGCGCRQVGSTNGGGAWAVVALGVLATRLRRRFARHRPSARA